jgi:tripartite-type tricarboxylate transporter receptor subunit TctC
MIKWFFLMFGLTLLAGGAGGQSFPAKPVKIVIPFPISGPTDIRGTLRMTRTYRTIAQNAPPPISDTLARIAAEAIRSDSAYPVVLERQPGAVTTRGASYVAKSPADGHTLLLASNATMVINPHFFGEASYDPVRDLELVAPLATMPFVLLARSDLLPESPQALIAWLRPRPGEINYGSSGDGSTGHLAGELFRRMAKVNIVHVSYNGGVAALNGMATRQISLVFAAQPLAFGYLPSAHYRAIAVTGAARSERLPEIPTLVESGLPELKLEGWYGMFAPAGNPPGAKAWLRERIVAMFAEPATQAQLVALGLDPVMTPPGQFATRIHTEYERWAPVLRATRLPLKEGRDG